MRQPRDVYAQWRRCQRNRGNAAARAARRSAAKCEGCRTLCAREGDLRLRMGARGIQ